MHIIRLVGGEPYRRAADEAVAQALNAAGYTVGTPGLKKAGGK